MVDLPPLRDYQIEALDVINSALKTKNIALLSAVMGAGKTAMMCRFIQRFFWGYPEMTFLVVMHRHTLVSQFYESFKKFTNIHENNIGICCSGLKSRELKKRITIASIQTIVNVLGDYPGADLVIIDETHHASGFKSETQYSTLISTLRNYKPNHKLIGLTATAYRLNHGFIYGDKCKQGNINVFPELTHKITYAELRDAGYLVPLTGYIADGNAAQEIKSIALLSGEYNLGQSGRVMSKYVTAAVDAMEQYAPDEKMVAVLACTIDHAEKLCAEFIKRGHTATMVHSKLSMNQREKNMIDWKAGVYKVCVSVNILTEGWDHPPLACLIFCRPTKATALFLQAVGRILRSSPGKTSATLIDLTSNAIDFGLDLDNLIVKLPTSNGTAGEAPTKVCPAVDADGKACGAVVHAACRVCPECGHEWTKEEVEAILPELKKVVFESQNIEPPQWFSVVHMDVSIHTNATKGTRLLRVSFECEPESLYDRPIFVSDWICLPDYYSGYAVQKGLQKWEMFTDKPCPATVELGQWYAENSFTTPKRLLLKKDGRWYKILEYDFEIEPEPVFSTTPAASTTWEDELPF